MIETTIRIVLLLAGVLCIGTAVFFPSPAESQSGVGFDVSTSIVGEPVTTNDKGQFVGTEIPLSTTKITKFPGIAWNTAADRPEPLDLWAEEITDRRTGLKTWKLGYALRGSAARYPMTLSSDYKRLDLDLDNDALIYADGKCMTFTEFKLAARPESE